MKQTVAITGSHYGGTSAASGVVHLLGFPTLIAGTGRANEDELIHKVKRDKEKFSLVIKQRNNKFDNWGFKIPNLTREELFWLDGELRNPKFIFVFRDPVAVAFHGRDPSTQRVKLHSKGLLNKYLWFTEFALDRDNCLFVSYEKLCTHPRKMVSVIAGFLGVALTEDLLVQCERFVDRKRGYLSVKEFIR